jgi:hypothetical protein
MISLVARLVVLVLALMPPMAPSVNAQDSESQAVMRFRRTIEAEASTILFAAHPTGIHKSTTFVDYQKSRQGHELTYSVDWMSRDKKAPIDFTTMFTFTFTLARTGEVEQLTIAVPNDSAPTKAFRVADLSLRNR